MRVKEEQIQLLEEAVRVESYSKGFDDTFEQVLRQ